MFLDYQALISRLEKDIDLNLDNILKENIGIRIKNDIFITNSNPIDLLKYVPIEIDQIEKLMFK